MHKFLFYTKLIPVFHIENRSIFHVTREILLGHIQNYRLSRSENENFEARVATIYSSCQRLESASTFAELPAQWGAFLLGMARDVVLAGALSNPF